MTDIKMNNAEPSENTAAAALAETIDFAYIFNQIKAIQDQTAYLNSAIEGLTLMSDGDSGECGAPGNIQGQGQAKAQALGDVVRCRETTNQQLLNFYVTVYNDMTS